MALKSITLIIISLLFLSLPGLLYNNLNANGLVVSQGQSLSCRPLQGGLPQDPTCVISGSSGCQASSNYCTLSGSSISFLNGNSPFTSLIQGNILGLFTGINSKGAIQGPFDVAGGGAYYSAQCQVKFNPANRNWVNLWQGFTFHSCTQTQADTDNSTIRQAANWTNWNTNWMGATHTTHLVNLLSNGTYSLICNPQAFVNATTNGFLGLGSTNNNIFSWYGCDFIKANVGAEASPPTVFSWGLLIALPPADPLHTSGCTAYCHIPVFIQPEAWPTLYCGLSFGDPQTYKYFTTQPCNNFYEASALAAPGGTSTIFAGTGFFSPILTFFIGIAIFLMGLGLQISAGIDPGPGFNLGVNPQGTRLAQTLGLALLIYSFLYSEFSPWFTSGLLPYGLDGSFGIISIAITGMLFFGVMWATLTSVGA